MNLHKNLKRMLSWMLSIVMILGVMQLNLIADHHPGRYPLHRWDR